MEKLLTEINRIFSQFSFRVHPKCITDIVDEFENLGNSQKFLDQLTTRLKQLRGMGHQSTKLKGFENVQNHSNMYAIKIKCGHNIRILYAYQNGNEYLLLAFYEKIGKGVTEYEAHIPPAKKRFAEMK